MKILITGAAGFIGSHLVDLLLAEGVKHSDLKLLIPVGESLDNLPKKPFEIIRGDIRDKKVVQKAMEGVQIVYHLAARIDFDGKSYAEYKDVNVDGTQNLLDSSRDKKLQKFVFFSSIGVFGLPAGIGDIINWDENHPKTYTNFYGESKYEGEKRVIEAYDKWKIPYAIIRPASVYGPREKGPTLGLYKAIKNHQFIMIGDGSNKMHYVFVTDLVKAARLAQLSKKPTGDYIIGGQNADRFIDIANSVATSINMKIPRFFLPKTLALAVSYIMEFVGNITGIKFPLFPSRVRTMTTSYFYNISKVQKELGYDPQIDFRKGSKITGEWYMQNKLL
ncbi:MAG: NAD-dependent epimerase/dehydratase family protein [Candidatus Daviesbacteria bacterium]|nr:NAD-dependent epimerase/dehydratase family protein [Candidatus Daviesbacteria bacterium]